MGPTERVVAEEKLREQCAQADVQALLRTFAGDKAKALDYLAVTPVATDSEPAPVQYDLLGNSEAIKVKSPNLKDAEDIRKRVISILREG